MLDVREVQWLLRLTNIKYFTEVGNTVVNTKQLAGPRKLLSYANCNETAWNFRSSFIVTKRCLWKTMKTSSPLKNTGYSL
jgi:hypothetical protein